MDSVSSPHGFVLAEQPQSCRWHPGERQHGPIEIRRRSHRGRFSVEQASRLLYGFNGHRRDACATSKTHVAAAITKLAGCPICHDHADTDDRGAAIAARRATAL